MTGLVREAQYVVRENGLTLAAFLLFLALVAIAAAGHLVAPYNPLASDTAAALQPPSTLHWFGTDHLGRDILSRVLVAARLDLGIALAAVALSFVIGAAAGSAAGYFGGWTDRLVGRVTDTIMAFPHFVLAMGIVAALGNTIANIIYATAIINLPTYVRIARAEVAVRIPHVERRLDGERRQHVREQMTGEHPNVAIARKPCRIGERCVPARSSAADLSP